MTHVIKVTVDVPYPKEFEYRLEASNVWTATSRALRSLRKELKGKRIKVYRIVSTTL